MTGSLGEGAAGEAWHAFDHDPRDPRFAGLRASDRERDVVRSLLATAFAEGRLDRDEFDERSSAVDTARRLGDFPPLIGDLVPERPDVHAARGLVAARPEDLHRLAVAEWRSERRNAVVGLVGSSLLCWAIWLAVTFSSGSFDPHFPWPLIVMALSVANLVRVATGREEIVGDHVRRLEKKRAKQLRGRRPKGHGR